MNHDVFISYSNVNRNIADALCHVLEEYKIKCWIAPRNINVGEKYGNVIEKAISACRIFVIIFSKDSRISPWVESELNLAFTDRKIIMPFRIDDSKLEGEMRLMLNNKHWIDAFPDPYSSFGNLLEAIAKLVDIDISGNKKDKIDISVPPLILKIKTDSDCIVLKDGEKIIEIEKDGWGKLSLPLGTYLLTFINRLDITDKIEKVYTAKDPDTEDLLLINFNKNQTINKKNQENEIIGFIIHKTPNELTSFDSETEIASSPEDILTNYKKPGLNLLQKNEKEIIINEKEISKTKDRILEVLLSFGIKISHVEVTVGNSVTLYEFIPKAGFKKSKLKNLEYDLQFNLTNAKIRLVSSSHDNLKFTLGIEIPNENQITVSLYSVLATKAFNQNDMELPVALGKSTDNKTVVCDLTKFPHLLIAGKFGTGKSVLINSIIASLLYKKHPSELKFVLIDLKKTEFSIYNKIEKHFLAKLYDDENAIIYDVNKVVRTLHSLIREMDDRYQLLKKVQVRNISEYNKLYSIQKLTIENGHRYLPYIVVIIDEFADIIMSVGNEFEMPLIRIAQLSRAVGIYLIISTQRPSVNIITGVIKANFSTRIAFKVNSMLDSRTILDETGAELLTGNGDMLFSYYGLYRIQSTFIQTVESENIIHYISQQQAYPSAFLLPEPEGNYATEASEVNKEEVDNIYSVVMEFILETDNVTVSSIMKNFSIGYQRARRLVDKLEEEGFIQSNNEHKKILPVNNKIKNYLASQSE